MVGRDRVLVWFLRGYSAVLLAALPFAVMPTPWLAVSYQAVGLGEWPELALVEYLARSASGVSALIGATTLLLSFDVGRYRPLIVLLGWVSIPSSAYLFVLALLVGLPLWWVLLEGPVVLLTGVVLLVLARRPAG